MAKDKISYVCSECDKTYYKWQGQCSSCQEWSTIHEVIESKADLNNVNIQREKTSWVKTDTKGIVPLKEVKKEKLSRIKIPIEELNNVFGGGICLASTNIISGDPGVGKSTLLIQALCSVAGEYKSLYVSGEESPWQIKDRAERLGLNLDNAYISSLTQVEEVLEEVVKNEFKLVIIDSIQTMYSKNNNSPAGTVGQLKDCTTLINQCSKSNNICFVIIGHVTKDGAMAGPKVLEHIVDGVFYFEGSNERYRILRSLKNRFGQVNEIGVFVMTEKGLKDVGDSSSIFLSQNNDISNVGCCVFSAKDGNRAVLYEVQSLVIESDSDIPPKRVFNGLQHNRVNLILAILKKNQICEFGKKDIYLNIVGGAQMQPHETSYDLSVAFSAFSSAKNIEMPKSLMAFGEISLSGEVRQVLFGEDRIKEAHKHGFKHIILPKANYHKSFEKNGLKLYPVVTIAEAFDIYRSLKIK